MARPISKNNLADCLRDLIMLHINRRSYSIAAATVSNTNSSKSSERMTGTMSKHEGNSSVKEPSWVPDPVSGYYKPGNQISGPDTQQDRVVPSGSNSKP